MIAGKRCNPAVLYIALAVILFSLGYFATRHGQNDLHPAAVPMHQAQ
jgi:hypothetical protein